MHHPSGHPAQGFDYRTGAAVDTALPLPRRGLLAWTIALPIFGAAALLFPWLALLVSMRRPAQLGQLFKEGGAPTLLLAFLYVAATIAITLCGIFAVRGRRVPLEPLVGAAIAPGFVAVLGAFWSQNRMTNALASVSTGTMQVRIGAMGYSEVDSLLLLGMLLTGCLCTQVAVAALGAVLTVDSRNLEASTGARHGSLWLIGTAIAAVLFVLLVVVHLVLDGGGGVQPKLSFVVLFAGAIAAGPLFKVMSAVASASPEATTAADRQRVSAALVCGAVALALATFLLDHAAFTAVERNVLATVGMESDTGAALVTLLGGNLRAASTNLTIDTIAAAFLLGPALVLALRRPPWIAVGASVTIVVLFAIGLGGWSLSRRSKLREWAAHEDARRTDLADLTPIKHGARVNTDVHFAVGPSGAVREMAYASSYTTEIVIAPDRNAPFSAVAAASVRPRASSSTRLGTSGPQAAVHVVLVGRGDPVVFPPSLEQYRVFQPSPLRALSAEITPATANIPVLGSSSLIVYALSAERAKISCMGTREVFAREISLSEPEAAASAITTLRNQCFSPEVVVAPLDGAKVEDVFRLLAALPSNVLPANTYASSSMKTRILPERTAATAWLESNPPGPRQTGLLGGSAFATSTDRVRLGLPTVSAALTPAAVQTVVARSLPVFERCYDVGRQLRPRLSGRVAVIFAIDSDGSVVSAQDGGSSLGDAATASCIVRAFSNLTFPQHNGRVVIVNMPVYLTSPN
jgi:hypothetical protein